MTWYAMLATRRREFIVRDEVEALGFECFTPIEVREPRRRRGARRRSAPVAFPRLPGYVFANFEQIPWQQLVRVNDFRGFVRKSVDGAQVPAPIPWEQIEAARALSTLEVIMEPEPGALAPLFKGQAVKIVQGPFAGLPTTVDDVVKDHYKALVDFLGKACAVHFEREQLEPA